MTIGNINMARPHDNDFEQKIYDCYHNVRGELISLKAQIDFLNSEMTDMKEDHKDALKKQDNHIMSTNTSINGLTQALQEHINQQTQRDIRRDTEQTKFLTEYRTERRVFSFLAGGFLMFLGWLVSIDYIQLPKPGHELQAATLPQPATDKILKK